MEGASNILFALDLPKSSKRWLSYQTNIHKCYKGRQHHREYGLIILKVE
jgi:hypothetical protein